MNHGDDGRGADEDEDHSPAPIRPCGSTAYGACHESSRKALIRQSVDPDIGRAPMPAGSSARSDARTGPQCMCPRCPRRRNACSHARDTSLRNPSTRSTLPGTAWYERRNACDGRRQPLEPFLEASIAKTGRTQASRRRSSKLQPMRSAPVVRTIFPKCVPESISSCALRASVSAKVL